jgi:hypothetical protein
LRYTASSTSKREPDGFFLFRLPSSSSSCFTLEFCLLQVTYTRCRFSFFLLSLLQGTVVVGSSVPE